MAEYIKREKAKRLLHIEYAYAAEQLLDEIPAADVAPVVHGRWLEFPCNHKPSRIRHIEKWVTNKGSVCEYSNGRKKTHYCPNCGAKMDGGADNG